MMHWMTDRSRANVRQQCSQDKVEEYGLSAHMHTSLETITGRQAGLSVGRSMRMDIEECSGLPKKHWLQCRVVHHPEH